MRRVVLLFCCACVGVTMVACGSKYENKSGQTYKARPGDLMHTANNGDLKLIEVDTNGIVLEWQGGGNPRIEMPRGDRSHDLGNKEKLVIIDLDTEKAILTYEFHRRSKVHPFDF